VSCWKNNLGGLKIISQMSKRSLRGMWVGISLVCPVILLMVFYKPILGLLNQIEADRLIYSIPVLSSKEFGGFYCEIDSTFNASEREKITSALNHLSDALIFQPENPRSLLLQGRAYCLLGKWKDAEISYTKYISLRPKNPLGHIELGALYLTIGELEKADAEWGKAGVSHLEILTSARQSQDAGLWQQALNRYQLANRWSQTDPFFKMALGNFCQENYSHAQEFCDKNLADRGNNWLVNTDFQYGSSFWGIYLYDRNYTFETVNCPDIQDKNCAHIRISTLNPGGGAGFFQCVTLQPGAKYLYSVWVKVIVPPDGRWRPLYYGGLKDGKSVGNFACCDVGAQSSQWQWVQMELPDPGWDQGNVCFHPVRLESEGEVWFHSPELKKIP